VLSAELPYKTLRVIPYQCFGGAHNMAIDFALASVLTATDSAILRFYGWKPFCLSLGKHQDISEVDMAALSRDGFDLVRRPTGGSAIFHAGELTYSFIAPLTGLSHQELYLEFHNILTHALVQLGYRVDMHTTESHDAYLNKGTPTFACFNRAAFAEIKYDGKKLVGSAQRLLGNVLLQHGSILINSTHNLIWKYLNRDENEKNKARIWLERNAVSLYDILKKEVDPVDLSQHIIDSWKESSAVCVINQALSAEELSYSKKFINTFKVEFNQEAL